MVQCNLKWLNEIKSDLAWHETKQPTLHAEPQKYNSEVDKSRLKWFSQCGVWRNTITFGAKIKEWMTVTRSHTGSASLTKRVPVKFSEFASFYFILQCISIRRYVFESTRGDLDLETNRETKLDVTWSYIKRQKWNLSSLNSRVKTVFVFVANSRRHFSIFMWFNEGLEEKNTEVIFAVCRLT